MVLNARIDGTVLGFVCVLAFTAALVSGLVPALRATGQSLAPALQSGARSATPGRRRRWLGRSLLCTQLALSLFLVASACLFGFSMRKLLSFDVGVDRHNLVQVQIDPVEAGYESTLGSPMVRQVLVRLRSLPGVTSATFAQAGVFTGANLEAVVQVEGTQQADQQALFDYVGPRFFSTIGAKLVAGRDFDERGPPRGAPRCSGQPALRVKGLSGARPSRQDSSARNGQNEVADCRDCAGYT